VLNSDHPDARCVDPGIAVLRWTGALPPDLRIPIIMAPIFFLGFFASALGEEIGWQGYAFGYLRSRWNALESAVILGAAWALWHVIPFLQTHCGSGARGLWLRLDMLRQTAIELPVPFLQSRFSATAALRQTTSLSRPVRAGLRARRA